MGGATPLLERVTFGLAALFRRGYRAPSKRTWSKQHEKLRVRRPLVDAFALHELQPEKEWWRERRSVPDTFMGFPDVAKFELVGTSLYSEQMDATTLSIILERCVKEQIFSDVIWAKLCLRAKQIASRCSASELVRIFKAHAEANWFDQHFWISYLGRITGRLPLMRVGQCALVIEAMQENEKFLHAETRQLVLEHVTLLLGAESCSSDFAEAGEVCQLMGSLLSGSVSDLFPIFKSCEAHLLSREEHVFIKVESSLLTTVLDCQATMFRRRAEPDLYWRIMRTLKDRVDDLDSAGVEKTLWALQRLHVKHPKMLYRLLRRFLIIMPQLNAEQLGRCCYAVGKLRVNIRSVIESVTTGVRKKASTEMIMPDLARSFYGLMQLEKLQSVVPDVLAPALLGCLEKHCNNNNKEDVLLIYGACFRGKSLLRSSSSSKHEKDEDCSFVDAIAAICTRRLRVVDCDAEELAFLAVDVSCFLRKIIIYNKNHNGFCVDQKCFSIPKTRHIPPKQLVQDFFAVIAAKAKTLDSSQLASGIYAASVLQAGSNLVEQLSVMTELVTTFASCDDIPHVGSISLVLEALSRFPQAVWERCQTDSLCLRLYSNARLLKADRLLAVAKAMFALKLQHRHRRLMARLGEIVEMRKYEMKQVDLASLVRAYDENRLPRKFYEEDET